jgi:hypothetical protein
MPAIREWFSSIQMNNLKVIIDLLGTDVHRALRDVKPKYATPLETLRENFAMLEKINAAVAVNGPVALNADGSPKIDADANVVFIPEINDKQILHIITEMNNAAKAILSVSKHKFAADNVEGMKLQQLSNICEKMEKSHEQSKFKIQINTLADYLKDNNKTEIPYSESKNIQWFDAAFIKKLEDAYQVMENKIRSDGPNMGITPEMMAEPRGINEKKSGSGPDVCEPTNTSNKVLSDLNTLYASLQQLKNINEKVSELGAFAITGKEKLKFEYSPERLDDVQIVNINNNLQQSASALLSHFANKSSLEHQALMTLKENKVFEESSARKNELSLEFVKNYFKNNPPPLVEPPQNVNADTPAPDVQVSDSIIVQPVAAPVPDPDSLVKTFEYKPNLEDMTSTLIPDSPIVASSRDNGFLDQSNIEAIKSILDKSGYFISNTKMVDKEAVREITNADHKSFTLSNREMKTKDTDIKTFKTMLQCFEATHNKLPIIITANQALKEKWMTACKEVFPERKIDFDSMITIKKSPQVGTPAPEPTPDEPSNHAKMRR